MLPLVIPLKPSPAGLGFLFLHGLPLVCLVGAGVPGWVCGLVAVLVLASLVKCLWKIVRDWRRSLSFHVAGDVFLICGGDDSVEIRLMAESCILDCVQILRWQDPSGNAGSACLLRSGFSEAEWRSLRAWLRWQPKRSSA